MPQLASTLAVNNISAIFLFASVPAGVLDLLAIKNKDWLFAFFNVIGAMELFIMILIIYLIFDV